ncbi:MAG TPA: hypothetical protein VLE48_06415 [Terriglobales bacterium]|nr:hypothetical protein [Terriglobales bacterium]
MPIRFVLLLFVIVVAGCGSDTVLNPRFQPEINNATDNFQFQATNVTNVNDQLQYTWQNTGMQANVNQACSITAGTASLTIRDSAGTVVYSGDLRNNGTFVTNAGPSGGWTIAVSLSGVSGTLNFRVQKNP